MSHNTRDLKIELLELLGEKELRQEIQFAQSTGAIVVRNRDGTVKVIRLQFMEATNGRPG